MSKNNDTISPDAHLSSLKDFSKQVRNRTIFFILFNVYAFLNVLATTDKDIFLLNPIKMPLLNIELPLIAFYIIIPLILVSLHFNLMYKLLSYRTFLERSLKDYKQAIDSLPFGIYEEILLGKGLFLKNILKIFFFFITYLMPIIVLLTFWYRFADYHDFVISSYHLLLAFVSFVVAFYFVSHKKVLKSLVKTDGYLKAESFVKEYINEKYSKIPSKLLRWFVYYVIPLIFVSILVWAFIYPYHLIIKEVSKDTEEIINKEFIEEKENFIKGNFILLTVKFGFLEEFMERPALNVSGEILVKGVDKEILEIIREFKNGDKSLLHYVPRTDYSGRNFSFANLSESILINSDLRETNLFKAKLWGANLYGTNLRKANLSGTVLAHANLSGAKLWGANLYETNLEKANLSGVDLGLANLSGARLGYANLSGAYLGGANLSRAGLRNVNLSRADLRNANLFGAILWRANLSGADLEKANLSGCYVEEVDFLGAILESAKLKGVCGNKKRKNAVFYIYCNKPAVKRLYNKADLSKIKNEILTEEKIKKIIEDWEEVAKNWSETDKRKFLEKWRKLLYQYKGKTMLEWIKAQDVDLGEFTEKDLREFLCALILGLNKDDFINEFKAYIQYLIENKKLSKERIIDFIENYVTEERKSIRFSKFGHFFKDQALKLLDEIEKELIEEYGKN